MTAAKPQKPPARKTPARKPSKSAHVFRTPVVELNVSARCIHGCYVITPNMTTLWSFVGMDEVIDAGPGCGQEDIVIHSHLNDDLEEPCFDTCWTDEEG